MKKEEKASISIMKIICISVILILISGIGVMAVNTKLNDVKITLENGYEMTALTSKTKVSDILKENNIILDENQKTIPDLDAEVTAGQSIKITDKSYNEVQIAKISEEGTQTTLDQLLENYAPITEKIIVEQEAIPYETITKNSVASDGNTTSKVLQEGKEGLKEITYKVKYQNNQEIERTVLSEKIVQEPVDKIVQISKKATSRSMSLPRTSSSLTSSINTSANAGGTVFKITAYTLAEGSGTGRTASGTKPVQGRTVAASSQFAFGTKLNIGGHIYTVEDRGGAIKGNKLDIFVNSKTEAIQWGVRYLPVTVVN